MKLLCVSVTVSPAGVGVIALRRRRCRRRCRRRRRTKRERLRALGRVGAEACGTAVEIYER